MTTRTTIEKPMMIRSRFPSSNPPERGLTPLTNSRPLPTTFSLTTQSSPVCSARSRIRPPLGMPTPATTKSESAPPTTMFLSRGKGYMRVPTSRGSSEIFSKKGVSSAASSASPVARPIAFIAVSRSRAALLEASACVAKRSTALANTTSICWSSTSRPALLRFRLATSSFSTAASTPAVPTATVSLEKMAANRKQAPLIAAQAAEGVRVATMVVRGWRRIGSTSRLRVQQRPAACPSGVSGAATARVSRYKGRSTAMPSPTPRWRSPHRSAPARSTSRRDAQDCGFPLVRCRVSGFCTFTVKTVDDRQVRLCMLVCDTDRRRIPNSTRTCTSRTSVATASVS
mmetsp:Transcript_93864/g.251174  ORF Transcript_93864/g.251174 Transcript_93864/m.251174 type:complete len:343 (+) Transcript_93864:1587-2615(+)